ncbi:pyroglutamyl-peptidase 1 [Diachasma alloeum]|uniref:pyroglutamyl-peptidase 1 n=1 Tax=Diachasma alloeum TaxID=454923 RepID=UPI0007383BE7|nr:pyroglutamyl-peptidase 1 [Diachasma alloeum]
MEKTNMTGGRKRNVVVTGFGPFGVHPVNASWEAVKLLKERSSKKLKDLYNIDLIIEAIPVVYDYVASRIPEIWKEHDPLFVVHVGVSGKANCVTIESHASSSGYTRRDVVEKCPNDCGMACTRLSVGLDVNAICQNVKDKFNCDICVSDDAGRYLCEYTLYQSLAIEQHRTLFVHVPDLDCYSSEETERGIFGVICCLIESLGE